MYDLNLLPLHNPNGQTDVPLPGFHAANPPRRAARSRAEDQLIVALFLNNNGELDNTIHQSYVEKMEHIFFKTGGSVTAALRTLVETMNMTLLEHNLRNAQNRITGGLTIAAVHKRYLYLVQSGPVHAFAINHEGLTHFHDPSQSDRGLGVSRTPAIRYFQAELGTGAYFFAAESAPETWTEERLLSGGFPGIEQLRRRLYNQVPVGFRLGLVQMQPGEGNIHSLATSPAKKAEREIVRQPAALEPAPVKPQPETPAAADAALEPIDQTQQIFAHQPPTAAEGEHRHFGEVKPEPSPPAAQSNFSETVEHPPKGLSAHPEQPSARSAPYTTQPTPVKAERPAQPVLTPEELAQAREKGIKGLAWFFDGWHTVSSAVGNFFKQLYIRFSPDGVNGTPELSRGTMLLIAVAVPLGIVLLSMSVYLVRGRAIQYEFFYDQAQAASNNAAATQDINSARTSWAQALEYIDQAAEFKTTSELNEMRTYVETALDNLDGAIRLTYHPAIIGALNSSLEITRIISFGPDLYLLDSAGGQAIHATRTSRGYEINTAFQCGPGNYAGGRIDAIVDMASMPINNPYQAHILVIDAAGSVAFCGPGQTPTVQNLPAPEGSPGSVKRIAFAGDYLYVLNPDAVNIYHSTNSQFLEPPNRFFAAEGADKPDLSQVVDLAVKGTELYLLRRDGLMVSCVATGLPGNPVVCEDPVTYVDGRSGKEEQIVVMPESHFIAILHTSPPDPSVTILDATEADIYRFSLRFRLHQRLRPELGDYEIESPQATGFTIGIDRIAFIAFGHQVFYAIVD